MTARPALQETRHTVASLVADLRRLGIRPGDVLLVHAAMRRIGRVTGGAAAVVAALTNIVGPSGTLVVPTQTADNSDTSNAHLSRIAGMTPEQVQRFRAAMPPFDPVTTPSTGMGRLAEQIRIGPGAIRSAHPQTSFAALGPLAAKLMSDHRLDCHLGEFSPLARLYEVEAKVLLLGVGYNVCTAFHLAEYRYLVSPPRREYHCVIADGGRRRWHSYEDVVLDDGDFGELGADLERTGAAVTGRVGGAECRLLPLMAAVDFAVAWLRRHRGAAIVVEAGASR
jgi:aminoglycoside 3-N-acetyltransferase